MVEHKPLIIPLLRALPSKTGGIQKLVFQTCLRLQKEGFEVEILLDAENDKEFYADGLKIIPVQFPPIFKYPFGARYWEFRKRLKVVQNLVNQRYNNREVIIIGYWINDIFLLAELNKIPSVKTIFEFHSPYHINKFKALFSKEYLFSPRLKRIILEINKFVYISQSLFEQSINNNVIPENKKIIIRNSYDNIPVFSKASSNSKKQFIILQRLAKSKNISFIIDGLHLYYKDNPCFICDIYGEGEEKEFIENRIKEKGLEKNIFLKGYINNPSKILSNYDYLLSASLMEGLSLSVIEAICAGVTPVLSNIPSHNEVLGNEKDHLIFNLDSPQEFLNILQNYEQKEIQEKAQIQNSLLDYVKSEFDPIARISKIKRLLQEV